MNHIFLPYTSHQHAWYWVDLHHDVIKIELKDAQEKEVAKA
jgi:hypothetical protein